MDHHKLKDLLPQSIGFFNVEASKYVIPSPSWDATYYDSLRKYQLCMNYSATYEHIYMGIYPLKGNKMLYNYADKSFNKCITAINEWCFFE